MYSEKLKEKIVDLCFEDLSCSVAKESTGFKAFASQIFTLKGIYKPEDKIFVCRKDAKVDVETYYSGKLEGEKIRFRVVKKQESSYFFKVNLDGEELILECDQYEID